MKCSKPRFALRPLIENLESRLQPGSVITGQAYGWSLLADHRSILDQGSLDSQSLVSPFSPESSKPTVTSTPVGVPSDILDIAVASVAAARSEISVVPTNSLVEDLAADLTTEDLANLSLTDRPNLVSLAAVATPSAGQIPPVITTAGSVPHSPIGVATPAQAAVPVASPTTPASPTYSGLRAVPAHISNLFTPTVQDLTGYRVTNDLHTIPVTVARMLPEPSGSAGNQATINFLSYLGGGSFMEGGSGPDSINSVVVRNEGGTNFIYVAGSLTDGKGRTEGFAAKLTDGATSVVWATPLIGPTPAGPDNAVGLAVNPNGVYVAGSRADPTATMQTDGFIAKLDPNTGALGNVGTLSNASLAAVTTDATGNVYVAGSIPDSIDAKQQDVAFMEVTGDLLTEIRMANVRFVTFTHLDASASVTTGSSILVDAQGIVYLAGSIGIVGDPNNDMLPLFFRFNPATARLEWVFTPAFNYAGPGEIGTAMAFDPFGHIVVTGKFNDNTGTPLGQDLLLARVGKEPMSADLTPPIVVDSQGRPDAWQWYVDDRSGGDNPPRAGDWTGNGLVVLADGSSIVTGAAYDPAAPNNPPLSLPSKGIDVHLTHFTPTDDSTVTTRIRGEGDPENLFGGSGTDVGNAVALDPTNPTKVYVVGFTTSTDLPTTPGVLQATYGGKSTTGFVGQASVL